MPPRLQGLTIMRFLAAFWVVLFHLNGRVSFAAGPWTGNLLQNGAYAMSLFFILSGLVLTHGYASLAGSAGVRNFYLARLARIYPAYATVHLLALFWVWPQDANGWVHGLYVNVLSALGLQAWFVHSFSYGANSGTWTISVEFFFYALFPLLLPLLHEVRRLHGTVAVWLGLVLLSGLAGFADYIFNDQGYTWLYYTLPVMRLPEFALGILLGLALKDLAPAASTARRLGGLVVAAAVTLLVVSLPRSLLGGGNWVRGNLLVVPVLGWLLWAVAAAEVHLRPAWRGLFSRIFIYLGESSYCLFLGHLVPVMFLDSPAGRVWRAKLIGHGLSVELGIVFLVASFAMAVGLHEGIEKPARRFLQRRWQLQSKATP